MASYQEMLARYMELRRQGYSGQQAEAEAFGEGGIRGAQQARARQDARARQMAGFGQVAGSVGGLYLANEGMDALSEAFGSGGGEQLADALGGGSLSIERAVPPPTTTVDGSGAMVDLGGGGAGAGVPATPKVISVEGNVANIQTPAGVEQVPAEALNDPGFFQSIDWAKAAQGGAGAMQLYQAYQAAKGGDVAGAGILGVAGGANLAASGALGSIAQTAAGDALGGYLIPGANIAAGLYGGYKTAEALSDMAAGKQRYRAGAMGGAASGAAIGSAILPGVGTAVGAAVGALAGTLGAKFGSGKGKGQVQRDAVRGALQEQGVLDDNFQGTLADGTVADFGKDGSVLKTSAMEKMAESNPTAYESTVQLSDALVSAYGFLGDKNRSLGRMFVRGALSNAGDDPNIAMQNMKHFAAQQGITFDLMKSNLDQGLAEGRIEQPEYDRLLSAATQLVPPEGAEPAQVREVRPEAGQVNRLSAGMYRDASGNLVKAGSTREALNRAYGRTKRQNNQGRQPEL